MGKFHLSAWNLAIRRSRKCSLGFCPCSWGKPDISRKSNELPRQTGGIQQKNSHDPYNDTLTRVSGPNNRVQSRLCGE